MTVLIPLGVAGLAAIMIAILVVSYCQTIEAHPTNGGSYIIAREKLGADPTP